MSKASRQTLFNMVVCAVGVGIAWLVVVAILSHLKRQPIAGAKPTALVIVFMFCIVGMAVTWAYSRKRRGELVLDCGTHPSRWSFVSLAVTGVGLGLPFENVLGIWGSVFGALFAAFWLFTATGRLGIYDSGIWVYWGLMRWDLVQNYTWTDDDKLLVTRKGYAPSLGAIVEFPEEHRREVAQLLDRYLPMIDSARQVDSEP